MSEARICRICKSELDPENHAHICYSCQGKITSVETKIDEL
jgi:Zn finger protein HypA/HybF involved in hydrogenase expression